MTSSVVDEDDGVSIVALILPICASLVGWGAKTFEFILRLLLLEILLGHRWQLFSC